MGSQEEETKRTDARGAGRASGGASDEGRSRERHSGAGEEAPKEKGGHPRLWVGDGGRPRPFMRGIMIHSLMARGVHFEEADRAANRIRDQLRGRREVSKLELVAELRKMLGDAPFQGEHNVPAPANIVVKGKGSGQPFSKGVLSQSLLAAAIDPNDAFDVARQIERELMRRHLPEVDRGELRALAYEMLSRTNGPKAAGRYLVWREYAYPDRPVIILLGGAPGAGKTSLALEVAHRLGIGRVLSSDSIRQIMRIMLSPELAPAIHGSAFDAHTRLPVGTLGSDPVIEGFRAQTATVSVGIRASMDRAVAENASTVLDGVSIVPGLIDLDAYEELADVIFLMVAALDTEDLADRFASRAKGQTHRAAHRYVENLDAILRIQDYCLEAADRHGVPIVDNDSFDRAVLLIIRHVTETLRKRSGIDPEDLL